MPDATPNHHHLLVLDLADRERILRSARSGVYGRVELSRLCRLGDLQRDKGESASQRGSVAYCMRHPIISTGSPPAST